MSAKGKAAMMIAQQVGVKDRTILNLVGYLAEAQIKMQPMKLHERGREGISVQVPVFVEAPGIINGKEFTVYISGPGAVECFDKIKA